MTSFVKKTRKKDVGIVTFDLIAGLLPTNHIIAYGIPEFERKRSMLTVK